MTSTLYLMRASALEAVLHTSFGDSKAGESGIVAKEGSWRNGDQGWPTFVNLPSGDV